ncbi:hypothetical protein CVV26_00675 [Candidatus Kuenenbacteria bacterium HGW-Kuenenbacteria-1]|uniref:DNA recombination protein RmuC n=1 Tax=Candidatus Kuenenbacteria bacterium HGW-Kuenenbacteria-1 TaxID=2013812 RepID=A0A2N1UPI0_9BACT|nr:MAG: hypothetical protein CVV26_00675 [Candidatus Kuenenbacteria bacterium HGW-Kuenenbacteria-1]
MQISMMIFIAIIAVLLIAGFGAFFYLLNKKFQELTEKQKNDPTINLLNQNIQGIQSNIQSNIQGMQSNMQNMQSNMHLQLSKTTEAINQRLDNAAKIINGVNKELGQMQEVGRQMKDLQDFLRSPKLRGNIGEQVLRDLLEQFFSKKHFELQYKFREGQIVDAIIKTDKGIIPIDSKFPMENFQKMFKTESEKEKNNFSREFIKDVKKHINDISKKYILPQEGTIDFAVMYIPSETIYYEIIRNDENLNTFAQEKKVLIVSPNSFYYFLRVIMIGMEGKRIEEASKIILQTLNAIQKDSIRFGENLGVLTTHITNAKSAIDRVNNEYSKLSGKIDQVKLLK